MRRSVLMTAGEFDTGLAICEDRGMWIRQAPAAPEGIVAMPLLRTHRYAGHSLSLTDLENWAQALEKVLVRH